MPYTNQLVKVADQLDDKGQYEAADMADKILRQAADQKDIYIVHGWGGHANESWFPWLAEQAEAEGHKVTRLSMPNTDEPEIEKWVDHLKTEIKDPDEDAYLVGHSIGCQTILRYLETLDIKIGGVLLVAPFFNLPYLETEEEKRIAKPWLETPIKIDEVRQSIGNITAIFSDDDPDVSIDDAPLFRDRLGAKVIIEHNKGHFTESDVGKELPVARDQLLRMVQ